MDRNPRQATYLLCVLDGPGAAAHSPCCILLCCSPGRSVFVNFLTKIATLVHVCQRPHARSEEQAIEPCSSSQQKDMSAHSQPDTANNRLFIIRSRTPSRVRHHCAWPAGITPTSAAACYSSLLYSCVRLLENTCADPSKTDVPWWPCTALCISAGAQAQLSLIKSVICKQSPTTSDATGDCTSLLYSLICRCQLCFSKASVAD